MSLLNGIRNIYSAGNPGKGLMVLLYQTVRQRRIKKAVDIEILLDERVVAHVVLADRFSHPLKLFFRLVVLFPSISRIAVSYQPLTPHLRRHQRLGRMFTRSPFVGRAILVKCPCIEAGSQLTFSWSSLHLNILAKIKSKGRVPANRQWSNVLKKSWQVLSTCENGMVLR